MSEPLMIDLGNGIKAMHGGPLQREITRLRQIEHAARDVVAENYDSACAYDPIGTPMLEKLLALRLALGEKGEK